MKNTEKLIALMDKYDVTAWHVAELLGVSSTTVRIWRCVSPKEIPTHKLELLEFKLKEKYQNT